MVHLQHIIIFLYTRYNTYDFEKKEDLYGNNKHTTLLHIYKKRLTSILLLYDVLKTNL